VETTAMATRDLFPCWPDREPAEVVYHGRVMVKRLLFHPTLLCCLYNALRDLCLLSHVNDFYLAERQR
jgi:hypothetical protein